MFFYFLFLNMRINEIIGIIMKEGVDNIYIDLGKQFMGYFKQHKKLKLSIASKKNYEWSLFLCGKNITNTYKRLKINPVMPPKFYF